MTRKYKFLFGRLNKVKTLIPKMMKWNWRKVQVIFLNGFNLYLVHMKKYLLEDVNLLNGSQYLEGLVFKSPSRDIWLKNYNIIVYDEDTCSKVWINVKMNSTIFP